MPADEPVQEYFANLKEAMHSALATASADRREQSE